MLTDEQRPYARELVWRERPDLVVGVTAAFPLAERELSRVAEGVQIIDQAAWALLHMQSSYAALIGHPTRERRRVSVSQGQLGGHIWRLLALVPPHFPLSRDDLRVSCYELAYRGQRGHGSNCGPGPNWQRVGGRIFVFGSTSRPLGRVRIRPWQGNGFDLTVPTVRAPRGPAVRYYATPLPEGACAVSVSALHQTPQQGSGVGPIRGRDSHRCAHASGSR